LATRRPSAHGLHPFLAQIQARHASLSPLQKKIVDFFLTRPSEAVYATTTVIARELHLSEASVVRCCRTLGFKGFRDFQNAFREYSSASLSRVSRIKLVADRRRPLARLVDDVMMNDINNLRATHNAVDHELILEVAETLWRARTIYVIGVRSAHSVAVFMHFALRLLGRPSRLVVPGIGDVPEQILDAGEGDVVIGISFERYAKATIELFDALIARGAAGVALTDKATSPLADKAKLILMCQTDYLTFVDSYVAPLSLANAILTVLAVGHGQATTASLGRMEEAWLLMNTY
jgi:DNA-binding MurR/RpiR family transcriptional regulator